MTFPKSLIALLALATLPGVAAAQAAKDLASMEKELVAGHVEFLVHRYPAGKDESPVQYRAELAFKRPGDYALLLYDMKGNKLDPGKLPLGPVAEAMLGDIGGLDRYFRLGDIARPKGYPLDAVRLDARVFGAEVSRANAWLFEGKLTGIELLLHDGTRVFLSVLGYETA